jgi:predicted nucleic acid-binding protein
MTAVVYLDTSALVKLIRGESETAALRAWLERTAAVFTSSALAGVELTRVARRAGETMVPLARQLLAGLATVAVTSSILQLAADLEPSMLRSLNAIHLATALEIGSSLTAFVAYDRRLLDAAGGLGVPVVAPA